MSVIAWANIWLTFHWKPAATLLHCLCQAALSLCGQISLVAPCPVQDRVVVGRIQDMVHKGKTSQKHKLVLMKVNDDVEMLLTL